MSLCAGGFPWDLLFKDTGYDQYWTERYDESPRDFRGYATGYGSALTGLFSNKAKCSPYPGTEPGEWTAANVWQSYCHNNTTHELTLIELYYNTCIRPNANGEREAFCNSITDQGGNSRRPKACGGNDPDLFTYNPVSVAQGEIGAAIGDVEAEADSIAEELIKATRNKIIIVTVIVIALIVLMILLFKD